MAMTDWESNMDEAHARRMQRRREFIESNPNAVSPWENRSTLGRAREVQDRRRLMVHELEMAEQKNAGDLAVAREKRLGMENQGAAAARANAAAAKHGADANLRQHELEWTTRGEIAAGEDATKRYGIDKGLEGTKDTNDTNLDIAERQMDSALKVEEARGKSAVEVAREQARASAAATARKEAREDAKAAQAREKRIADTAARLAKLDKYKKATAEELRAAAEAVVGKGLEAIRED